MAPQITDYKITKITHDGTNVKIYWMQPVEGQKIQFKPGQFVNLYLQAAEGQIFRQFSIASSPNANELEFCIKIIQEGKFTSRLGVMKEGDTLKLLGPFGHFAYVGQDNCVFLAGGTGIAPIISMLRYITENKIKGKFTLFYSNKTKDAILYAKELAQLSAKNPNINIVFTLTQEIPGGWKGETSRINDAMLRKHVSEPGTASWYSCGPLDFVTKIKEFALSNGVPPERIKIEGWG